MAGFQQARRIPGWLRVVGGGGKHCVGELSFSRVEESTDTSDARSDFWHYFQPILEGMASNCSADVQAVIAHIDSVFTSNNTGAINTILDMFNMTELSNHLDDAAGACKLWHARLLAL